ncbi:MAG: VCBS repeat-containing protein [Myxococcales bacterium]|nr:VCBS repeat-containing protein [Myxococcales bacterium]
MAFVFGSLFLVPACDDGGRDGPPAVQYLSTCSRPLDLLAADVNGDGDTDLVVQCERAIAVHPGLGAPVHTAVVPPLWGLVAGDFDGDGKIDLAAGGLTIQLLRGRGDGTFEPPTQLLGQPGAVWLAADLDGVGPTDLILKTADSTVTVVVDGQEAARFSHPLVQLLSAVAVDLEGDGDLDVVLAGGENHTGLAAMFVIENDGAGRFRERVLEVGRDDIASITAMATHSGRGQGGELLVASTTAHRLQVRGDQAIVSESSCLWTGGGVRLPNGCDYSLAQAIVADDFDQDGRSDFAVLLDSPYTGHPSLVFSRGDDPGRVPVAWDGTLHGGGGMVALPAQAGQPPRLAIAEQLRDRIVLLSAAALP